MPGLKLGFDLGSDRMRICVGDRGLVSDEPLIAAVDAYTGDVLAFGEEAGKMNRRVPSSIEIKSFISGGRITDFELAEKVISEKLSYYCGYRLLKPSVYILSPMSSVTLYRITITDLFRSAGAGSVEFVDTCEAAALGAGVDYSAARGVMIADAGRGSFCCATLSLGGVCAETFRETGGQTMTEAIIKHAYEVKGLEISYETAEYLKTTIGTAAPGGVELFCSVPGVSALKKNPLYVEFGAKELCSVIRPVAAVFAGAMRDAAEASEPDIVADISRTGCVLCGGCASLRGIAPFLEKMTDIPVKAVADSPDLCAVNGLGEIMNR